MRRLLAVSILVLAMAAHSEAAPSDDIRAYCADLLYRSGYHLRLVCEREEKAARERLYKQADMPYGIPPDIWEYCGRMPSWQVMETCTRQELRAKGLLAK